MSPQGPWGTIYGLPTPPSTPGSVVEIGEKVKAKVEHPFLKVKWQFGYAKVRYRGLSTTWNDWPCAGLADLLAARGWLVA